MPIHIGAGANLADVRIGSVQVELVYLGNTLKWRNNQAPFFAIRDTNASGTLLSTSGTPLVPVDPIEPDVAVLITKEYSQSIPIFINAFTDEDDHYPVTFNLYEGDFDMDPALISLDSVTLTADGDTGTLFVPRGALPTEPDAVDFIYTNRLFSVVAEDTEEGIAIQYFRLTGTDSTDTRVLGSWVNDGGTYSSFSNPIVQSGLTTTVNTQCFDVTSTTITFTRTTPRTQASQDQTRTCSVTVIGIVDSPALTCAGFTDRTITVTISTGAPSDVTTGTFDFANPSYISGATVSNNVGGSICVSVAASVSIGACTGSVGCGLIPATCPGGTQTVTTQPQCQDQNCAGSFVGAAYNDGAASVTSQTCSFTNPDFEPGFATITTCGIGGSDMDIAIIRTTQNRQNVSGTVSGTCLDGTPFSFGATTTCSVGTDIADSDPPGTTCPGRENRVVLACSAANPINVINCAW